MCAAEVAGRTSDVKFGCHENPLAIPAPITRSGLYIRVGGGYGRASRRAGARVASRSYVCSIARGAFRFVARRVLFCVCVFVCLFVSRFVFWFCVFVSSRFAFRVLVLCLCFVRTFVRRCGWALAGRWLCVGWVASGHWVGCGCRLGGCGLPVGWLPAG